MKRKFGARIGVIAGPLLVRVGLRFDDPDLERAFQDHLAKQALPLARYTLALGIATYALFGLWDLTSLSGGLYSTRFRFMVGCPVLTVILGLSFLSAIRPFWQIFLFLSCIAAFLLVYETTLLDELETAFKIDGGNAIANFMLGGIFICLFLVHLAYMIGLQIIIQLMYVALLMRHSALTDDQIAYYASMLSSFSTVICLITYWREILMRRSFAVGSAAKDAEYSTSQTKDDASPMRYRTGWTSTSETKTSRHITISYRRDDSGVITGRIFDRLSAHYGRDAVFRDIDNIPPGTDFRVRVDEMLEATDVVLAIIGPEWLGSQAGASRLANPSDPVRLEIESALRKRKPLIPVLVLGASMPTVEQLPESLHELAYRHAASVDPGLDFDVHVRRLFRAIDQITQSPAGIDPRMASA